MVSEINEKTPEVMKILFLLYFISERKLPKQFKNDIELYSYLFDIPFEITQQIFDWLEGQGYINKAD